MNIAQRIIVTIGALWILAVCLFPPYGMKYTEYRRAYEGPTKSAEYTRPIGHRWIGSPPGGSGSITVNGGTVTDPYLDIRQLGTHIIAAVLFAGSLSLAFQSRRRDGQT